MRRIRTQEREAAFDRDLANWDWTSYGAGEDVDDMARELEKVIATLTERHFPMTRVRKRSNEDPWITRSIRQLWKKKIRCYKMGGKSAS